MTTVAGLELATGSHLNIAGASLRLDECDAAAGAAIAPALGHLMAREPVAEPMSLRVRIDPEMTHPHFAGEISTVRQSGRGVVVSRTDPDGVDVFDAATGLELVGTPEYLSSGEIRAHPARSAIATWLASARVAVLHLAAVVFDSAAVLLIGPGGAGKSTTALACGVEGAGVVGDDLCVVDVRGGGASVHALYATAKLHRDSVRLLGDHDWESLGRTRNGKQVVPIGGVLRLDGSAPIGAIAVLRPHSEPAGPTTRLSVGEATRWLTSTGMNAALGAGSLEDWFSVTLALARAVPTYHVSVPWDREGIAEAVAATLHRSPVAGSNGFARA